MHLALFEIVAHKQSASYLGRWSYTEEQTQEIQEELPIGGYTKNAV